MDEHIRILSINQNQLPTHLMSGTYNCSQRKIISHHKLVEEKRTEHYISPQPVPLLLFLLFSYNMI